MNNQKHVYISYHPEDQKIAEEIKISLEANGIGCLIDLDFPVGSAYASTVVKAIDNCDFFLVIMSKNSEKSKNMLTELEVASFNQKSIMAFWVDDFELSDAFRYYLGRKQWFIAYNGTEEAISKVINYIYQNQTVNQGKNIKRVFVSYASADKAVAYEIVKFLENSNIPCFIASRDICGEKAYAQALIEAIEGCDVFLLVASSAILEAEHILNEVDAAINKRKKLLPILIEDFEMSVQYRYYLARRQCVIAYPEDVHTYFEKIRALITEQPATVSKGTKIFDNTQRITKELSPYNGEKDFIFISYSHKNSGSVLEIVGKLIDDGYRVWYDEGIDPGTEWDDFIAGKIEQCGYFIAFISEEYLDSDNCKDELNYARDIDKDRLLVYLTDVKLTGGLAMRLNRLQAIHKYTYSSVDAFLEKLKSTPGLDDYID